MEVHVAIKFIIQIVHDVEFFWILIMSLFDVWFVEDDLPVVFVPIHLETVKVVVEGFVWISVQVKPSDVHYKFWPEIIFNWYEVGDLKFSTRFNDS